MHPELNSQLARIRRDELLHPAPRTRSALLAALRAIRTR
jgi:hypothetical protein